ncbi:MAG: hypothetical protein ACPGGK_07985 [Pikeienuella sp.]
MFIGADKSLPLTSMKAEAELQEIANDQGLLSRRVGRVQTMFEARQQAVGDSQTADNPADGTDRDTDLGMVANTLSGRLGVAAGDVGRKVASAATGNNEGTRNQIAKVTLSQKPGDQFKVMAMQSIVNSSRRRVADARRRSNWNWQATNQ